MTKPRENFIGSGLTEEEIGIGKQRFADYRKNYPQLNKLSNLQLLEELVWLECLQERYKKQIGVVTQPAPSADGKVKIEPVPRHMQEAINTGLDQIINLKTKLGLFEDQKVLDAFKDFENLKKKASEYRMAHPLSFKTTCPHCSKIFFLKRRTDKFEEFKSPFYADDKVLKNDVLHSLYKQGKITKEEEADVLGVSPDMIDWLDENIYKNAKSKGV